MKAVRERVLPGLLQPVAAAADSQPAETYALCALRPVTQHALSRRCLRLTAACLWPLSAAPATSCCARTGGRCAWSTPSCGAVSSSSSMGRAPSLAASAAEEGEEPALAMPAA